MTPYGRIILMNLQDVKNKWIAFVDKMNKKGIPVPTVRDPKTGEGSITAALLVFSAGLFGLCILVMLGSTIAKWAGLFALNDISIGQVKSAADYSFQFLLAALGGYLGRHMQKGPGTVDLAESIQKEVPPTKPSQKVDSPD